jgi:hypothetical protein
MGDLISFPPSRKRERAEGGASRAEGASIHFFMGVRYNRECEPAQAPVEQESPPKGGLDGTGGRRRKRRG